MDILRELEAAGGLLTGHFVLKSGRHSDRYLNKDVIYPDTWFMSRVGERLGDEAEREFGISDLVIGPEKGGIVLSQWTGWYLSVSSLYAEKNGDGFVVKRNARLIAGRKVLIVEDIVTTGGSIQAVYDLIRPLGGEPVGCVCLVNRGRVRLPWLRWLAEVNVETWTADECPLCKAGIPINTDVGHGGKR